MRIMDSLRSAVVAAGGYLARNQQAGAITRGFNYQLSLSAYLASGMMQKVIGIPADDRVREWRDWQAESDQIGAIEKEEARLGLLAKVKEAEVLRGLGGGALILALPGPLNQPPSSVGRGALAAVNAISRWELQLLDIERNMASVDYGKPRMFRINGGQQGQQDIHPSRVVCFRGSPLPRVLGISDEDAFWGISRLERVVSEVQKSDNASLWFAELVKKAKLLRIGIPGLTDFTATEDGQSKLNARVALIAAGESTLNATVYDAGSGSEVGGEKITDYQVTWAGIPAMMDAFDQRVAAVADIPFTRLMGRSPAGMNATGESDQTNWNKMVAAGQKLELRPCLEAIDVYLLPSAGVSPEKVTWRFAPLDVPSEKQEAETFDKTMDAVTKLQATGAIPDQAFTKGVQNLMEEREYIPGLAQALAEIPEDERFGLVPGDDGTDPSALQAKGGDQSSSAGDGGETDGSGQPARRAANDKVKGSENGI